VLSNAIYNDKKCIRKTSAKITFLNSVGPKHIEPPYQATKRYFLRAAAAAARVGRPTNSRGAA